MSLKDSTVPSSPGWIEPSIFTAVYIYGCRWLFNMTTKIYKTLMEQCDSKPHKTTFAYFPHVTRCSFENPTPTNQCFHLKPQTKSQLLTFTMEWFCANVQETFQKFPTPADQRFQLSYFANNHRYLGKTADTCLDHGVLLGSLKELKIPHHCRSMLSFENLCK